MEIESLTQMIFVAALALRLWAAPAAAYPPDDNPPPEWAEHFGESLDPMTYAKERLAFEDQAVEAYLAQTQKEQSVETRCGAITELSKLPFFGRPKVRARIVALTRDGEPVQVRIAAVRALSQPAAEAYSDTRVVLLGLAMTEVDDAEPVRVEAIRGLVSMGALTKGAPNRGAVRDALASMMMSSYESTAVRVAAIVALRDSGATATDPGLRDRLAWFCAELTDPIEVKQAACGAQ